MFSELSAKVATVAVVLAGFSAVAGLPASRKYANQLRGDDRMYYAAGPYHSYGFRWEGSPEVTLSASSPTVGLRLEVENRPPSVVGPGEVAQVVVPNASRLKVFVVAKNERDVGDYELEVSPPPSAEEKVPVPLAERGPPPAPKPPRQEPAARRNLVAERTAKQRASCADGSIKVYFASRRAGVTTYYFCDATTVRLASDGEATVAPGLGGPHYEQFVARESAALEVARHNAEVLKTQVAANRAAAASGAFEAKVQQYVKKYCWPKPKYVQAAKASTVEVVDE